MLMGFTEYSTLASSIVTVEALASAAALSGAAVTSFNFNNQTVTIGNALAVVITQGTAVNLTGMTVTWDGVPMTQVANKAGVNGETWIFGLLAPNPGNKTLALSWTGAGQVYVDSVSLKGVTQASIGAAFTNNAINSGSSTTPTVTVTSQANDLVISAFASLANFNTTYSGSGTEIYHSNSGATWTGAASYDLGGSPNVAATITTTASNAWLACGIDVVHA